VEEKSPQKTQRGRTASKEKRVVFTTKGTKFKKNNLRFFVSFVNFVVKKSLV
jgi:hypothetical protein